jgi:glutamine synthetase
MTVERGHHEVGSAGQQEINYSSTRSCRAPTT